MLNWRYSMFCIVFIAGTSLAEVSQSHRDVTEMHQEALGLARNGEIPRALEQLAQLRAIYPDRAQYLYDYIAVLGWAERDTDVIHHAEQLRPDQLPPYLLETIGKSARNLKRYDYAIRAYRTAMQRAPQRLQSRLGLALALSDAGEGGQALEVLADYEAADVGDRLAILETKAYANISDKRYFAALALYEKQLQLTPDHKSALRGRILMVHRLGAPHLAAEMAADLPGLLSDDELALIASDVAAITIRWGRLYAPSRAIESHQQDQTQKTIALLYQRLDELRAEGKERTLRYHKVAFDLMVALQVEQRMTEVVGLYEALLTKSVILPRHAKIAAADAYLALEQPAVARDIYLDVLNNGKDDLAVQLSLFYAYIECEQHDRAIELIDRLNEQQPRWVTVMGSPRAQKNPDKVSVEITAAYARAYIDQLDEAQRRLEPLHRQAPVNLDIRSGLAYIYLWRGWPRRALEEMEIAGLYDDQYLEAWIGRIHAHQALYEFPTVEKDLLALNSRYPDHLRTRNVNRMWKIHNMRELRIALSHGTSSGSQEGSRDLIINTHLFDRPWRYHFRPYLHHFHTQASFPESRVQYRRFGAGIEYRGRDLEARSELSRNLGGSADIGLNSEARWMIDDYWALSARLDSYTNDVPLRGREQGIDGRGSSIGVTYRLHELRRFDASFNLLEFSDGNRRKSSSLSVDQRLITKVDYKLNGIASLGFSSNTRNNAPYFNPTSDLTLQLGVVNEWLLARHYDYAYRHRLSVMAGQYQQENYQDRAIWSLRYEHQWNFDDRTELRYAISRSQRAYDGVTEFNTAFDLIFIWRF